jgi:hypothetical protein
MGTLGSTVGVAASIFAGVNTSLDALNDMAAVMENQPEA